MSESRSPEFLGNFILRGKIECITGLHVGGSKDKLEIGGVDSPVIRNPQTRYPYIPGSSLKGKMRHLLEYGLGVVNPTGDVSEDEKIVRLFGIGADDENKKDRNKLGPSRLVFRDCNPDATTIAMWKSMDSELQYTEYKPENTIDRITSAANPRFIERVVAGSFFNFEIVYTAYDMGKGSAEDAQKEYKEDLENLQQAMRMLEHNFIGKSGSRGYGRIRFKLMNPVALNPEDYKENSKDYKKAVADIPPAKDLEYMIGIHKDFFKTDKFKKRTV